MTGEFVVAAAIVGLLVGWLADVVMEGGGYGVIGDVLLGVGGGLAGASIFVALGFAPNAGWMAIVGAAFVGAVALIYTQRMLWRTSPDSASSAR